MVAVKENNDWLNKDFMSKDDNLKIKIHLGAFKKRMWGDDLIKYELKHSVKETTCPRWICNFLKFAVLP